MSTDQGIRGLPASPLVLGENLQLLPVPSLSLYVHIPFCANRCRYCNFYFETGWSPRVLDRTLETILQESQACREQLFPSGSPQIKTVYFGGGTPSIIPPQRLDRFLSDFSKIWQLHANQKPNLVLEEWAFEANPESLTWDLLEVLGKQGVDRISLGVQSLSSEALQLLGRRAAPVDVERALTCIQKARQQSIWQGKLNIDLICGIPGQTVRDISEDIRRLLAYEPDHFSLYTLTVEPGTPLQQLFDSGSRQAMDAEGVESIWEAADQALEGYGFHNYEISNYAKPGCQSRHNLAYWNLSPYLGLGPGAVGTVPAMVNGASRQVVRLTNPSALAYSRPSRPGWEHQVEILGSKEFLMDHFLTGLRLEAGFSLTKLESIFALPAGAISRTLAPLLESWRQSGWLSDQFDPQKTIALSRSGRFILNSLLEPLMDAVYQADHLFAENQSPRWP